MNDLNQENVNWHDAYLCETKETILECLSKNGESIVNITFTPKGMKIVEACDGQYGITLSKLQVDRLIHELQELSSIID